MGLCGFFGAASIVLNGSTPLTFTISNPNVSTALTGVGFTDTLPSTPLPLGGLRVSAPNGLTGNCGGGTITAPAGSTFVNLAGATLGAGASCTFSLNVTGNKLGAWNNVTSAVTSVEGGAGGSSGTASATLTVALIVPATPANIPAVQPWALGLLGLLLVVTTSVVLRGHKIG